MIQPDNFINFAVGVLFETEPSEAALRRAVSAAYYGLFHNLTTAGSARYSDGGRALLAQVTRAYNHSTMRRVCELYLRSRSQVLTPPLDRLVQGTPDERLLLIAETFVDCQDGRHAADYDLTISVTWDQAASLVFAASDACAELRAIRNQPEAAVFLTALLLADRWTRRG